MQSSGTIRVLHGSTGRLGALGAGRVALGALATLVGWAVIRLLAEARVDEVGPAAAAVWDAL